MGTTTIVPRHSSPSPLHQLARPSLTSNDMESQSVLNSCPHPPKTVMESLVFLGESTSLRLVHDRPTPLTADGDSPCGNSSLQYPLSDALAMSHLVPASEIQRREARFAYLQRQGAFSIPPHSTCDVLLRAYFRWFHPCFPIVDRNSTITSYHAETLSPLLLKAMLFIGVIFAEDSDFCALDLGDRHSARYTFYNDAKDLYDADYETDRLQVLQSVFLLSFWRVGPLLHKDTRHWLGVAIGLAQTGAMHRSFADRRSSQVKLRKRLWWCIYIRERQCSAALGLPNRISDEDCDIEILEPADLAETIWDSECSPLLDPQTSADISYIIGMARLTQILGKIVRKEYLPKSTPAMSEENRLREELEQWQRELPENMKATDSTEGVSSFLANMLHLAYNNLLILLYRSAYINNTASTLDPKGSIAFNAACRSTRIIEDMLAASMLHHGHIHLITSIFNALCVHTVNIQRSQGTARNVAQHRAKLCLLGLRELQKTWEVTNWVLHLFFKFLDSSTVRRLQLDDEDAPTSLKSTRAPSDSSSRTESTASNFPPLQSGGRLASALPPWSWQTQESDKPSMPSEHRDFVLNHTGHNEYALSAYDAGILEFSDFNSVDMESLARCFS